MLALLALLAAAPVASPPVRPRLAVVIVIDQLAARDFDARLPNTTRGIRRLVNEGFRVNELTYEAAPTITSVGHATISTGAWAGVHGIVGNHWFDQAEGHAVLSTEDSKFVTLGRDAKPRDCTSPLRLQADTLGDAIKSRFAGSKTATVAGKDRAAILLGGRSADLALWLDAEAPVFTSSTYYLPQLPAWVGTANDALTKVLPPATKELAGRTGDSEPAVERIEIQAAVDKTQIDLALLEVEQLKLGTDDATPDLLAISFSGHDRIGHAVGPIAPEAISEFMTIDAEIGRLLDGLDKLVGKGRYTVALTSDHGVGQPPEVLTPRRIDAGRVDTKALLKVLRAEAEAALGPGEWIAGWWSPGFGVAADKRVKVQSIYERLRAVAKKQPGVNDLMWQRDVCQSPDPQAAFWCRGIYPGRTPELILETRPYWLPGMDVASHGTAWTYDRIVPLVLFGAGVKKGSMQKADVIDVAPTLAVLLGAPRPAASTGRVLIEAFAEPR